MDLSQSCYGEVAVSKLEERSHSLEANQGSGMSTTNATLCKKSRQAGLESGELESLDSNCISGIELQRSLCNEVEPSANNALDVRVCLGPCSQLNLLTNTE